MEKLKKKYGVNKLRQVMTLYNIGLPEKYWFSPITETETLAVEQLKGMIQSGSSVAIVTNNITEANKIVSILVRELLKSKTVCRYLDFVYVVNTMIDKFGQMNMELIGQMNSCELISITNIRSYGKMYDRMMGVFSSFVDSLFNGVMDKSIVMCIEVESNDLGDIGKIYGDELYRTIESSFEIYQYIVGVQNETE